MRSHATAGCRRRSCCAAWLTHRTPGPAIWTCAVLAIVVTLYGDAFSVLSAGSAVFLFISYAMPIGSGMLAEGRS